MIQAALVGSHTSQHTGLRAVGAAHPLVSRIYSGALCYVLSAVSRCYFHVHVQRLGGGWWVRVPALPLPPRSATPLPIYTAAVTITTPFFCCCPHCALRV
jgi:hypothetical protein